jgi:hypothetical protein
MALSFEDKSGQPPSRQDIDEAILVCKKAVIVFRANLPPELVVNLPNIIRCLEHAKKHV